MKNYLFSKLREKLFGRKKIKIKKSTKLNLELLEDRMVPSISLDTSIFSPIYGQDIAISAIVSNNDNSAPSGDVNFYVNGNLADQESVTGSTGIANFDLGILHAGTYNVHAVYEYDNSYADLDITVTPANATITATSFNSVMYGTYDPSILNGFASGLLNGDTDSSIGEGFTSNATSTSGVGNYSIIPYANDPDYNFTFVNGTLTISPAPLILYGDTLVMTYGNSATVTGHADGLVNGDTISSVGATFSSSIALDSNAGYYNGVISASCTNTNYNVFYINGDLEIDPANATLYANNSTMTYGDSSVVTSGYATGLVNGDDDNTVGESFNNVVALTSNAGYYLGAIVPVAASSNYNWTYVNNDLTINKADATLYGNNFSIYFQQDIPTLTGGAYGLVNGDTSTSINESYTTSALSTSPSGDYPVVPTAVSNNYNFTINNGNLVINKANVVGEIESNESPAYVGDTVTLTALFINADANIPIPEGTIVNFYNSANVLIGAGFTVNGYAFTEYTWNHSGPSTDGDNIVFASISSLNEIDASNFFVSTTNNLATYELGITVNDVPTITQTLANGFFWSQTAIIHVETNSPFGLGAPLALTSLSAAVGMADWDTDYGTFNGNSYIIDFQQFQQPYSPIIKPTGVPEFTNNIYLDGIEYFAGLNGCGVTINGSLQNSAILKVAHGYYCAVDNAILTEAATLATGLDAPPPSANGGAISNNGYLTVTNCTISNNCAGQGGGLYNGPGGTLNVSTCQIFENNAWGNGGGVYNLNGILNISDTPIYLNGTKGNGGGVYSEYNGDILTHNSNLYNEGFAIGNITISGSGTITGNIAGRLLDSRIPIGGDGGGIYLKGLDQVTTSDGQGSATANISVSIESNKAFGNGGGVSSVGNYLTTLSGELSSNYARGMISIDVFDEETALTAGMGGGVNIGKFGWVKTTGTISNNYGTYGGYDNLFGLGAISCYGAQVAVQYYPSGWDASTGTGLWYYSGTTIAPSTDSKPNVCCYYNPSTNTYVETPDTTSAWWIP